MDIVYSYSDGTFISFTSEEWICLVYTAKNSLLIFALSIGVTLQLSILLWLGIHTKYLQKRSWLTFWGLPHVDTLQNALLWLLNR